MSPCSLRSLETKTMRTTILIRVNHTCLCLYLSVTTTPVSTTTAPNIIAVHGGSAAASSLIWTACTIIVDRTATSSCATESSGTPSTRTLLSATSQWWWDDAAATTAPLLHLAYKTINSIRDRTAPAASRQMSTQEKLSVKFNRKSVLLWVLYEKQTSKYSQQDRFSVNLTDYYFPCILTQCNCRIFLTDVMSSTRPAGSPFIRI